MRSTNVDVGNDVSACSYNVKIFKQLEIDVNHQYLVVGKIISHMKVCPVSKF